ncbi:Uncharacterised protein [Klebsiella pneumoniae]|nr:Uncharacterised protein [Klebsiella pneumoniae]
MMSVIRLSLLLVFFISPGAMAADFNIVALPDGQGYKLTGSISETDIRKHDRPGIKKPYTGVTYSVNGLIYSYVSYNEWCEEDLQKQVDWWNRKLSAGIILHSKSTTSVKNYLVQMDCDYGGNRRTGSWTFEQTLPFPPVDESSPQCNVVVPAIADMGNVSFGNIAHVTLSGKITCDKAATMKVRLVNIADRTSPGVLKIGDARVRYDIDGDPESKIYSVAAAAASGPLSFSLNFALSHPGSQEGDKSGSVLLLAEVQ